MSFGLYQPHIALALEMIALVSGVLLVNKAVSQADFFCKKTGKIVGGAVMLLSILSVLCTLYLTYRNYQAGAGMKGMGQHWTHPPMGDMPMMESAPDKPAK